MPFVGLVHLAIAACFGVHAVRSGQPIDWLFALFAFALLGTIVYVFASCVPPLRHRRGGIRAAPTAEPLERRAEGRATRGPGSTALRFRLPRSEPRADRAIERGVEANEHLSAST